jgi:membrane-bound serine protease (ClpP class)
MFLLIQSLLSGILAFAGMALEIKIDGSINPGSADYIISAIKMANEKYSALIIKLNTPGGLLSSTRDIIQAINSSEVPVILFVTPSGGSATSAGALIALSAHYVAMTPGSNIGAAHPVGPGGESAKGAMEDKAVQDTAAMARSQAQLRGKNVELAEKIVTLSLSFTAEEAKSKKLIDFVVASDEELYKVLAPKLKIESSEELKMNLKQKFLHTIADPNVSTLLLSLAGIAIYTEISSGFSLVAPGILGVLMLLLGFVSLQMLPITTGGGILMILGLVLLVAELFVASFGLLAIGGITSIFIGSLFLVDNVQLGLGISPILVGSILFSLAAIIGIFGYIIWNDRKVTYKSGLEALIGEVARVQSVQDSHRGVILVNGELWNCYSESPLAPGKEVIIKEFKANHFVVI